ncbi:MAG: hypothetical protein P8176_14140 [Gammaproteobacteria bacterium]
MQQGRSVWNVGTNHQLNETISSWTTSPDVSKQFKGGVPPVGYQGVIFKVTPAEKIDVIINLHELFLCQEFNDYLDANKGEVIGFDRGTGMYWNSQFEVVISGEYLNISTLFAWGGYTSPESDLAKMYFGHEANDEELELFRDLMGQAGHKCGAYWLTTPDAVSRVSNKLKRHGNGCQKLRLSKIILILKCKSIEKLPFPKQLAINCTQVCFIANLIPI